MKRLMTVFVVAGLVGWVVGSANAQNLLTNGNMDETAVSSMTLATPEGWIAEGDNNDAMSSEPWNNVADATGDCDGGTAGCGVFFKVFQGSVDTPFSAQLYQDNPGTPGLKYVLTGWAASGPGYSGIDSNTGTETVLALDFLDAGSGVLDSSELELGPGLATTAGGAGWIDRYGTEPYMVMGVAPAGTATVRARISMINAYPTGAGDSALVTDNYSLTAVPEPATLGLFSLGLVVFVGSRRR